MEITQTAFWLTLVRVLTILLTLFLAWITYRSSLFFKEFQPDFNLLLSPPEFLARVGLVGLCLLLAWLSGLPATRLGLTLAQPLFQVGLGLAVGVAIQVGVYLLTMAAIGRFGRQIYSPQVVRNILPRRRSEWVWVSLAFWPAVAMEELLFRTLWLGGFAGLVPLGVLIVGTSVVFGFMHQPQGLLGVILAGSINILFSLLFIWSGSLLSPLVAHYTVNMLQMVTAHFQRDQLESY